MRVEDLFHVGAIHRNLRFFRVAWVLNNPENQITNRNSYHHKQRSALPCQGGNEGERLRVHVLVDGW